MPKYHVVMEFDISLDDETVAGYPDKGANMLNNFKEDFDADPEAFLTMMDLDGADIKTVQTTHP